MSYKEEVIVHTTSFTCGLYKCGHMSSSLYTITPANTKSAIKYQNNLYSFRDISYIPTDYTKSSDFYFSQFALCQYNILWFIREIYLIRKQKLQQATCISTPTFSVFFCSESLHPAS